VKTCSNLFERGVDIDSPVRDQPSPVDVHIGCHIRLARQMRKLTQTELGVCIQLTFQQVQKYERGSNRVAASTLVKIASALSVPLSFFFEGLPDFAHGAMANSAPSAEGWEVAALVTSISHRGLRKRVLLIAREIAGILAESRGAEADQLREQSGEPLQLTRA